MAEERGTWLRHDKMCFASSVRICNRQCVQHIAEVCVACKFETHRGRGGSKSNKHVRNKRVRVQKNIMKRKEWTSGGCMCVHGISHKQVRVIWSIEWRKSIHHGRRLVDPRVKGAPPSLRTRSLLSSSFYYQLQL